MDRALKERLLGAAILVVIVVLVVPALLSGPRDPAERAVQPAPGLKSVEIDIAEAAPGPSASPEDPALARQEPAAADAADPGPRPAAGADGGSPPAAPGAAVPEPDRSGPGGNGQDPPAPPAAAPGWAVQVAALSRSEAAKELAARLVNRGYRAFVMEYRADGQVFYRVRVGPEGSREQAEGLAARLTADGHPGTVVAHP